MLAFGPTTNASRLVCKDDREWRGVRFCLTYRILLYFKRCVLSVHLNIYRQITTSVAFSRPMFYRLAASSPLSVSGDTEAWRLAYSGPSILTDWRVRFFRRKSLHMNNLAVSSKGIYKAVGLYNL